MFAILAMFLTGFAFAQKANVPANAISDLRTRFANSTSAKWEQSSQGYEAEWIQNGMEVAVVYDSKGAYVMTERQIPPTMLPEKVGAAVKSNFPAAEIQEAEIQEHADGAVSYQVSLKQNGKISEATFGNDGLLRKGGDEADENGGAGSDED